MVGEDPSVPTTTLRRALGPIRRNCGRDPTPGSFAKGVTYLIAEILRAADMGANPARLAGADPYPAD